MRHVANPIFIARVDYRKKLRWLLRWDRWVPRAPSPVAITLPPPPSGPVRGRPDEDTLAPPPPPRNPFSEHRF